MHAIIQRKGWKITSRNFSIFSFAYKVAFRSGSDAWLTSESNTVKFGTAFVKGLIFSLRNNSNNENEKKKKEKRKVLPV